MIELASGAPCIHCLGTLVFDRIFEVDRLPGPDDKVFVQAKRTEAGGPPRNVAMALAGWGDAVSLASAVGDDAVGRMLLDLVAAAGIDGASTRVVEGMTTAETVILVDAHGERSIIIDPVPEAVLAAIGSALAPATGDVVISNLFHARATADALSRARQAGALALVDLEAPEIDRWGWDAALEAARAADIVATNAQVLRAFAEREGIAADHEAAWKLAGIFEPAGGRVCVTLGAGGVLARDGAARLTLPALPITPRNTNGAGDRFLAGLAHALLGGAAFGQALRLASAAAGLHIAGATHGWDDIEQAALELESEGAG